MGTLDQGWIKALGIYSQETCCDLKGLLGLWASGHLYSGPHILLGEPQGSQVGEGQSLRSVLRIVCPQCPWTMIMGSLEGSQTGRGFPHGMLVMSCCTLSLGAC